MGKSLVIVESPAKVRTLSRFLGKDYLVKASVGHVKDLPKSKLGVAVEDGFRPSYHVIRGKREVLREIREAARKAERIYLATDPDREGEAIAWHVAEEIDADPDRIYRILFNEITERAVREALKNPGRIDMHKVEAQQARRILDRLVGYQISPLLWEKVRRGLSAGRVQSVAVRLICEREREIQAFRPEEYWSLTATLEGRNPPPFDARLVKVHGKKAKLSTEADTREVQAMLQDRPFVVERVETKERKRSPAPPFITSTLQQEAARKLGFTAKKTMTLAQRLYEGVDLGPRGTVALITYMRTDSVHVAEEAQQAAREYVENRYGSAYLPPKPPRYASKKGAQEAHEAIRPTSLALEPESVKKHLDRDAYRLYRLIWDRFLASQMAPALLDATLVDVAAGPCLFRATGTVVRFQGFMRVYTEGRDEEAPAADELLDEQERRLPLLEQGERLVVHRLTPKQHFTQPPPRYTEATLVKALEEKGIGRPSTYATILSTIQERGYVKKVEKKFHPTELGLLVNDLLVEHFPKVLNVAFTAKMEEELDKIEEGQLPWVRAVEDFYGPFSDSLDKARVRMRNVKVEEIPTDLACEKCGKPMVIKWGRHGQFLACSGFPECRNTKEFTRDEQGQIRPAEGSAGETCPSCGASMVIKRGRYGRFLACSNYPQCKTTRPLEGSQPAPPPEETQETCPSCGASMVIKRGRYGRFLACSNYPQCKTVQPATLGIACPQEGCNGVLAEKRTKQGRLFYACTNYPTCTYALWDKPVATPCPRCGHPFLVEKRRKRDGTYLKCPDSRCTHQEAAEPASAVEE